MGRISKFLMIVSFISLLSCKGCKKPTEEENGWQRNPNLKLLAKPVSPFKAYSDPVWSPSGKIYYLAAYEINGNHWVKQALKVINEDGTGDRILLEGEFQCLDISPDYNKLVIGTNDGKLLLVDTAGNLIAEYKTYFYYYGNLHYISCIRFGCSDSIVFYSGAIGSIYKMNLKDSIENFVQYESSPFDVVCPDNEIFQNEGTTGDGGWPIVLSEESIF